MPLPVSALIQQFVDPEVAAPVKAFSRVYLEMGLARLDEEGLKPALLELLKHVDTWYVRVSLRVCVRMCVCMCVCSCCGSSFWMLTFTRGNRNSHACLSNMAAVQVQNLCTATWFHLCRCSSEASNLRFCFLGTA